MNGERIEALEATEGWTWDTEDPFHNNLQNWITQFQKKGSTKPSAYAEDPEEKRAGKYQSHMRTAYKAYMKGTKSNSLRIMNQERIQALEATEGWMWVGTSKNN